MARPESRAVLATIASLSAGRPPAGVAVHRGLAAGGDGGLDDVVRRREVRLAGAEADDRLARRLERLRLRIDGEGRRLGDRRDATRDAALRGRQLGQGGLRRGDGGHAFIVSKTPTAAPASIDICTDVG